MKRYDKLVRDRIPEIIAGSGGHAHFIRVHGAERSRYLKQKLGEEAQELLQAEDVLEELTDVYEVLCALLDQSHLSWDALEDAAFKKRQERGGFKQGIVLKSVDSKLSQ